MRSVRPVSLSLGALACASCAIDWHPSGKADAGNETAPSADGGVTTEPNDHPLSEPDATVDGDTPGADAALPDAANGLGNSSSTTMCGATLCMHALGCTNDAMHCICLTGFEGDHCEVDIDECKPATGNSPCPDAFPCVDASGGYTCAGQLADFVPPPSVRSPDDFEQNAAGTTIRDHATGLVWLHASDTSNLSNLSFATDACKAADPESPGAYRLPSILEFATLFDEDNFPSLHPLFGSLPTGRYWTGTPNLLSNWSWDTSTGRLSDGSGDTFLTVMYTICVRTFEPHFRGYPDARFSVSTSANSVSDQRSQLTWQQSIAATPSNFATASAACRGAGSAYRLPTLVELLSTLDYGASTNAAALTFGPAFGPTWTSVSPAGSNTQHVAVDTHAGTDQIIDDTSATALVRCVQRTPTP